MKNLLKAALWRAGYQFMPVKAHEGGKLAHDEFVTYLQNLVGGFLAPGNLEAMERALNEMPSRGAVVEIGSFLGLSTNILAYTLQQRNCAQTFFSCDPWTYEGGLQSLTQTPEFNAWARRTFTENTRLLSAGRLPHTVEATSDAFFEMWGNNAVTDDVFGRTVQLGGPIAFCYIDGDHTEAATRRDFQNVHQNLLPGGFILFDDSSNHGYEGVQRVINEVSQNSDYEIAGTFPNVLARRVR